MEATKYLKVARNTPVQALAKSIVSAYKENNERPIILRSVGPVPLNQAIKAVIVANKDFIKIGLVTSIQPCFSSVSMPNTLEGEPDKENTAIELKINLTRI